MNGFEAISYNLNFTEIIQSFLCHHVLGAQAGESSKIDKIQKGLIRRRSKNKQGKQIINN